MNIHRHFDRVPYLFQDARYIHLLRDPRDVARSCISMDWFGHVYFRVDLWLEAENSWDRLKPKLHDGQYMEIKYEELLDDIETGLTKICHFLGVNYSVSMLDYTKNSTYSPPDRRLSYQWKKSYGMRELQRVEGKVGAMLVDRGYELSTFKPAKPGLLKRLQLAFHNKIFRVDFGIKKYGFLLYCESVFYRKLSLKIGRNLVQKRINEIDSQGLK